MNDADCTSGREPRSVVASFLIISDQTKFLDIVSANNTINSTIL